MSHQPAPRLTFDPSRRVMPAPPAPANWLAAWPRNRAGEYATIAELMVQASDSAAHAHAVGTTLS